jgi:hypothetical protein
VTEAALPGVATLVRIGGTALAVPAVIVGFGGAVAVVASLALVVLWWGRGGMAVATVFLLAATLAALVVARSPRVAGPTASGGVPARSAPA